MEAHMQMHITLFNGDDHEIWSIKMRTLLMARDLWDAIESGVSEENTNQHMMCSVTSQQDERIKDMTALHMLQMSVTNSIFLRIGRETSSKQAWEILKAEYGETDEIQNSKLTYLEIKFEEMMMKNEESVWHYIEKLMGLVNQIKLYGSNMSDQRVIRKILSSLPPRFNEIRSIMSGERIALTRVVYLLRKNKCQHVFKKHEEASHNHKRGRQ